MNDAPWTNLNVLCQLCAEVTGKESSLLLVLVKKLAVARGHILRTSPFYLLSSASCPAP